MYLINCVGFNYSMIVALLQSRCVTYIKLILLAFINLHHEQCSLINTSWQRSNIVTRVGDFLDPFSDYIKKKKSLATHLTIFWADVSNCLALNTSPAYITAGGYASWDQVLLTVWSLTKLHLFEPNKQSVATFTRTHFYIRIEFIPISDSEHTVYMKAIR